MAAQDDSILCPVCQEIYNDPRFLLCGHSFCLNCIKGVAGNKQKFPCPICRFCVDLRDGNVDQLPKNFVLSNVIDAKDMTHPSICVNHKKLLDIFCESCNVMICSKCLLLLHKGHAIEDIDKIFTERNEKLSAFLGITKLWTSTIQEKRYVVEQSRNCMKNNADSINKTVHKVFKKWYDDLQTPKNTILLYLQQEIEKRMQVYDEAESVLKSSMTTVTGLETEISKIRSKGTAFVVQQYDSIVASQEDTRRKILLDIDTCFTPPNDLKMEMFAPWIEEAIGNIQLTDMTQEEVRPRPQTIAEIQSENVVLKRDIERFKDENMRLEALLSRLHKYVTAGTEANYSSLELPSEIQPDSSVASNYKAAQDIWKKFMEIKGFSRQMGQQISEGNPNITDLSDQNRPSKLGERYSELYDYEWTNAFEVLTDKFGMNDKEAIDVLRNILLESYKSAFDISRSQMEEAEYKLSGSSKAVSPECKRLLKEARKHIDIKQSDSLKDALERIIMKATDKKFLNETLIQVFAKECFQLCWLMSIQDPPVVLAEDFIKGSRFDTSMYKHYTNSGDTVDYVVWPALLLHKGGPLLTKGIAQPVPKLRPKSGFTVGENKKTGNGASDKFSRSLYVPSQADRRNPSQVGSASQWDSASRKKPDNDPIETRTNLSQGGMAQTQRRTTNAAQFDINPSLVNDQDMENFKHFCYLYPTSNELTMKKLFGSDFERFYDQYIVQRFGN